jgi:hypothetical protein
MLFKLKENSKVNVQAINNNQQKVRIDMINDNQQVNPFIP